MNRVYLMMPVVCLIICIANIVHAIQTYGRQWECGRYGMPHSLVTPDATTYADGTRVDLFWAQIIRTNAEEEIWLGLVMLLAAVIGLWANEVRTMFVLRRKLAEIRAESAMYQRLRNGSRN